MKLGYLLVRTVAKPIASGIKRQARDHQAFRRVCVSIAQIYHRTEVKLKRGLDANKKRLQPPHNRPLQSGETTGSESAIRPLDEAKAVEVGSEFIGEALVFLVAGTLLVFDQLSNRQKEQERRGEIERRFTELYGELTAMKTVVEQLKKKE